MDWCSFELMLRFFYFFFFFIAIIISANCLPSFFFLFGSLATNEQQVTWIVSQFIEWKNFKLLTAIFSRKVKWYCVPASQPANRRMDKEGGRKREELTTREIYRSIVFSQMFFLFYFPFVLFIFHISSTFCPNILPKSRS